ncbi:hypothetical protein [Paraferrimonas sp. SM1919]|uniref:hypothetical protein n=1 Tax=Paraferrimonas sp. SM1919 TaxID=2662263 RepID=UPI0013D58EDC|nr:hypothetical protein [Paraferrimonas sp. SM1919]
MVSKFLKQLRSGHFKFQKRSTGSLVGFATLAILVMLFIIMLPIFIGIFLLSIVIMLLIGRNPIKQNQQLWKQWQSQRDFPGAARRRHKQQDRYSGRTFDHDPNE